MNTELIQKNIEKYHSHAKEKDMWNSIPTSMDCLFTACQHKKNLQLNKGIPSCSYFYGYPNDSFCKIRHKERILFITNKIDLITWESTKAAEAYKNGKKANFENYYSLENEDSRKEAFNVIVKKTLEYNIASIYAKTCDLMGYFNFTYEKQLYSHLTDTASFIRKITISSAEASEEIAYENMRQSSFSHILDCCYYIANLENFNLDFYNNLYFKYSV